MKLITDGQWEEYNNLKHWAIKQKVWESARSIKRLEDDIDLPIRKSVAMCALLGRRPLFSCCGFDYYGQPYHKYHQYDAPYITISENEKSSFLLNVGNVSGWKTEKHAPKTMKIEFRTEMNPSWGSRESIHSSEERAIAMSVLEKFLMNFYPYFAEEVALHDTNHRYKDGGVRFWQYPAKEPWVIKKSLLDTY